MGDRVGIGVAGIGVISALDVPGYLQHPDCDVVAVADPRVDRARERAAEWDVDTVYGSLDELYFVLVNLCTSRDFVSSRDSGV